MNRSPSNGTTLLVKAIDTRSDSTHTRKNANRGDSMAIRAMRHPMAGPYRPPAAAVVVTRSGRCPRRDQMSSPRSHELGQQRRGAGGAVALDGPVVHGSAGEVDERGGEGVGVELV